MKKKKIQIVNQKIIKTIIFLLLFLLLKIITIFPYQEKIESIKNRLLQSSRLQRKIQALNLPKDPTSLKHSLRTYLKVIKSQEPEENQVSLLKKSKRRKIRIVGFCPTSERSDVSLFNSDYLFLTITYTFVSVDNKNNNSIIMDSQIYFHQYRRPRVSNPT